MNIFLKFDLKFVKQESQKENKIGEKLFYYFIFSIKFYESKLINYHKNFSTSVLIGKRTFLVSQCFFFVT